MGGHRLRVRLSGAPAMSAVQVRALRDGAILAGLLFLAYLFLVVAPQAKTVGFDALSYYLYGIDNPYWLAHGTMGSFVYSPIAARLFQLDALLPFWQFLWLWLALLGSPHHSFLIKSSQIVTHYAFWHAYEKFTDVLGHFAYIPLYCRMHRDKVLRVLDDLR